MHHIGIGFEGIDQPLQGGLVTGRGLHGVMFNVLKQHDKAKATWLHRAGSPKPYTVAPYYAESGILAGVRLSALTERTADILKAGWQNAADKQLRLNLGPQAFTVRDIESVNGTTFKTLSSQLPTKTLGLRFLAPTAFRQGRGHLPVPIPKNVFMQPFRVWNTYADTQMRIPKDWLDWCYESVYIRELAIETVSIAISAKEPPFTGFVGDVWFEAKSDALLYLSLWQALAHLMPYSGVGHKTTMGCGAVEVLV